MRGNLEPLKYSTLVPSRYVVYLHPAEHARLEGIIAVLQEQTMRALSEEVAAQNGKSILRQTVQRIFRERNPQIENPAGAWSVEFLPHPDGDIQEGDILVDSELLLPASPELSLGEADSTHHDGPLDSANDVWAILRENRVRRSSRPSFV